MIVVGGMGCDVKPCFLYTAGNERKGDTLRTREPVKTLTNSFPFPPPLTGRAD